MPSYTLYYFDGRGRAETTRLLFALADVKYEDYRFKEGEWPEKKSTSPFGQAPYLEVDGTVLCQSHAIERFLARRFGYAGKSEMDQAKVDMLIECFEDLARELMKVVFEKDEAKKAEAKKKTLDELLPRHFGYLQKFLDDNKSGSGYLVGDSITLADVTLANIHSWLSYGDLAYDLADKHPKLKALVDRVNSNPGIAAYLANRKQTKF